MPADGNDLAQTEELVRKRVTEGAPVDFCEDNPEMCDPTGYTTWDSSRTIRSELLSDLLTATDLPSKVSRNSQVWICGARILGSMDLSGLTLSYPVIFDRCAFEGGVNLEGATTMNIGFSHCLLGNFYAPRAKINGNLSLNGIVVREGTLILAGAQVGGSIDLSGADLTNVDYSLFADELIAAENLDFGDGFRTNSTVSLRRAKIGRNVAFYGASITCPGHTALDASEIAVGGTLQMRALNAVGAVRFDEAHIGWLVLLDVSLTNSGGDALTAPGLLVDHRVYANGVVADGALRVTGCRVGESFDLERVELQGPDDWLLADDVTVEGAMRVEKDCRFGGQVRLIGSHIKRDLFWNGSLLSGSDGFALVAEKLIVDGNVIFEESFVSQGEVRMDNAVFGGSLLLAGLFEGDHYVCLSAKNLVAANVYTRPNLCVEGSIDLSNIAVREKLDIAENKSVKELDLREGTVNKFRDQESTWPGILRLDGFKYESMTGSTPMVTRASVAERLRWLRHDPSYSPNAYDQLASDYRKLDQEASARRVLIAKQWRRRSKSNPFNWFWYLIVGFGYRSWLAGVWLISYLTVGALVFDRAYSQQLLVPAKESPTSPTFHAIAFTLDLLLPIVNIGQEDAWVALGWAEPWIWATILVGWILTSAFVAGLSGAWKRN